MSETISIVTPVYNKAEYIEETLRSVEAQTCRDWELILVDDGSTDEGVQVILRHYGKVPPEVLEGEMRYRWELPGGGRVLLSVLEKNIGAAASRNVGLKLATGRYLAFLDSDDIWQPEKLNRTLAHLRSHHAAFVFTAYEFGDENAMGTGKIVHVPESLNYRQALSRTVIFTSTVLFDLEKLSKDDIRMPRISSEDTACWWTILKKGVIAYGLDENLTIYRRPKGGSLSSNKLHAIHRIWDLYRKREGMGVLESARYFVPWAIRATLRRL